MVRLEQGGCKADAAAFPEGQHQFDPSPDVVADASPLVAGLWQAAGRVKARLVTNLD